MDSPLRGVDSKSLVIGFFAAATIGIVLYAWTGSAEPPNSSKKPGRVPSALEKELRDHQLEVQQQNLRRLMIQKQQDAIKERELREQQDREFQMLLQRDQDLATKQKQEATRKKQEEEIQLILTAKAESLKLEEERARIDQEKARIERLRVLKESLQDPPLDSPQNQVFTCRIVLFDGEQITKKFHTEATFQQLKDFIDTKELEGLRIPTDYTLFVDYPRREFRDMQTKFCDSGLDLSRKLVFRVEAEVTGPQATEEGLRLA